VLEYRDVLSTNSLRKRKKTTKTAAAEEKKDNELKSIFQKTNLLKNCQRKEKKHSKRPNTRKKEKDKTRNTAGTHF
jgi:hypothetical protein